MRDHRTPFEMELDLEILQESYERLKLRFNDIDVENFKLRQKNRMLEDYILEQELPLPDPQGSIWYADLNGDMEEMQKRRIDDYRRAGVKI